MVSVMPNQGLHSKISAFEQSLDDQYRHQFGVHYTPPALIQVVLHDAMDAFAVSRPTWNASDGLTVCDPSCGAGAFLVDAAEYLLGRGLTPEQIVNHVIVGVDIDVAATTAAKSHLIDWAVSHGANKDGLAPNVHCGDALSIDWSQLSGVPTAGFDVIIGNPPFLGQFSATTSRTAHEQQRLNDRFGFGVGYADTSALFLLQAVELVAPGGVVALVQPQSVLAGSSTSAIRTAVATHGTLRSLWGCDASLFDAEVRVCVPTLIKHGHGKLMARSKTSPLSCDAANHVDSAPTHEQTVSVSWGLPIAQRYAVPHPTALDRWSPLIAPARNVPHVICTSDKTLGDLATATAGFRDEFYALSEACFDDVDDTQTSQPQLMSVGMIDVGTSTWGLTPRKIGGTKFHQPRVNLDALERHEPRIMRWVQRRLVPKVLVATQTKVIEALTDPTGSLVPLTPVVSVEPHVTLTVDDLTGHGFVLDDLTLLTSSLTTPLITPLANAASPNEHPDAATEIACRLIAAVLNSPVASAWAVAQFLGTGLSATSVRLSAKSILTIPLPTNAAAWSEAAGLLATLVSPTQAEQHDQTLRQFGQLMCVAYDIANVDEVMVWWDNRR